MEIKERIKKIGPYFKGMQIISDNNTQIIYVIINFPNGWIVDEEIAKKNNVTIERGQTPNEFYFATDIETGEEAIFDVIECNIDKMKNAIERAQLLASKTTELKELFENEDITLDELKQLTFQMPTKNENFMEKEILIPSKKVGRPKSEKNNENIEKTDEK